MSPYYCIYSFLFLLTFFSIRPREPRIVYLLAVLGIICFAALRGNGFDWDSYHNIYNAIRAGHTTEGNTFVEYGFELLCRISPSYKSLIAFVAIISLVSTFYGTYKFSKRFYPLLGLVIFSTTLLLPTYMGQIRQGISIGFVTIAIWQNYISQRKIALCWIIAACFFHISAFLSILIFFIPKREFSLKIYFLVSVAALLFYGLSMKLMTQFLTLTQLGIVQKLIVYATIEKEELGVSSTILIRIVTLALTVLLNKNKDKEISYIQKIYLLGILIYLLFGFLPQLGGRGSLYFSVYEMVLVPYIVYHFRKRHLICLTSLLAILGLSVFRIVSFFSDSFNYQSYIPYLLNR